MLRFATGIGWYGLTLAITACLLAVLFELIDFLAAHQTQVLAALFLIALAWLIFNPRLGS